MNLVQIVQTISQATQISFSISLHSLSSILFDFEKNIASNIMSITRVGAK